MGSYSSRSVSVGMVFVGLVGLVVVFVAFLNCTQDYTTLFAVVLASAVA